MSIDEPNPYTPPLEGARRRKRARPGVVLWARIYVFALALLWCLGLYFGWTSADRTGPHPAPDGGLHAVVVGVLFAIALGIAVPAILAALGPRRPWVWVLNLILIALGCLHCLSLPFAVPLLIYWLKPETKRWFKMERKPKRKRRSDTQEPR
jgi:hypothetical protein